MIVVGLHFIQFLIENFVLLNIQKLKFFDIFLKFHVLLENLEITFFKLQNLVILIFLSVLGTILANSFELNFVWICSEAILDAW
jgi:hypothetical protein